LYPTVWGSEIAGRYASATGARPLYLAQGEGGGLFAAKWRLPRYRIASVWAPHHVLGYRASGIATVTRSCAGAELRKVPPIGSVTFSPGDLPAEWSCDAPVEAIHVYIADTALRRFAEQNIGAGNAPRIRDFFGIADPWLAGYFQLLDSECARYPGDALFLEQTEHLLLRHLVHHHSDAARAAARAARARIAPLPRSVTRRIEEYIDANLDADVSLKTLATLAHMSVDHFVRAFRAATGKTPHRFVLDQRLARASAMLTTGSASIAGIARACGFRSAAHFSVKFHARFGVTPSQHRRAS
jgi:AraC family transcriptional regulator